MANTYTQLYIQLVFAVKGREQLIPELHRENVQKYITGIITNKDHKCLAIYAMPDHIHILIGYNPSDSISDLVRDIKVSSSKFISNQNWMPKGFKWQEGFGAFSYSRSHLDRIVKYIRNQKEHHSRQTFKAEYLELLENFNVDYNDKYLFDWVDCWGIFR